MARQKFNDAELHQLVNQGLSVTQIAKYLQVTKGAVSQQLKTLKVAMTKDVALVRAGDVVQKELNLVDHLQKISANANELLDLLMASITGEGTERDEALTKLGPRKPGDKDPKVLVLEAMREIRKQIEYQLKLVQSLYDIRVVAEFQEIVIEAIGEVSPEVREQIINKLRERRALRMGVNPCLS